MQVRVGCEFVQSAPAPVHTIVQVEPRRDGAPVVVSSLWDDTTWSSSHTYFDGFGNMCRRITFPMGTTVMRFDAVVEVDGSIDAMNESARELPAAALPPEALVFAMPSRYCPSDQLANVAGNLFGQLPPGWARVQGICDWVHANIHVTGRPEWRFIKIHTHGASLKADADEILGPEMDQALTYMEKTYNDGARYVLHYITAREAFNLARAAVDGKQGDPRQYYDYLIPPYVANRPGQLP